MLKTSLKVAIVGASGLAGKELINILEDSDLNISELSLFSSINSAGEKVEYKDQTLTIQELKNPKDIDADLVFLATDSKLSLDLAPKLVALGKTVIDKSSAFRATNPLIVPSVNGELLKNITGASIIASPNCVAGPLCEVLNPIKNKYGLLQVIVSSYQAVSGAGKNAMDELEEQVRDLFNLRELKQKAFDKRIAFNILPNIPSFGSLNSFGQTDEEEKVIFETKKILNAPDLLMQATCVRVPVFNGHCMSVSIATAERVTVEEISKLLANSFGIRIEEYPTPIEACGLDEILVGRIRPNTGVINGISLWIAADNLRVGAALNAVRIAMKIYEEN